MNGEFRNRIQNRRRFLRTVSSGPILATPLFVPRSVLGDRNRAPASERIVMGVVGLEAAVCT